MIFLSWRLHVSGASCGNTCEISRFDLTEVISGGEIPRKEPQTTSFREFLLTNIQPSSEVAERVWNSDDWVAWGLLLPEVADLSPKHLGKQSHRFHRSYLEIYISVSRLWRLEGRTYSPVSLHPNVTSMDRLDWMYQTIQGWTTTFDWDTWTRDAWVSLLWCSPRHPQMVCSGRW